MGHGSGDLTMCSVLGCVVCGRECEGARVRMWMYDGVYYVWAGPAAVNSCTPCVCGCVRLNRNSIGADGCAALAGALVRVPSLTTLGYVGVWCVWWVCGV